MDRAPCEHLPQLRGWIGWTDDGRRPTSAAEGGLFLEYIPTSVLGRKVAGSFDGPVDIHGPRVSRRVHIVDDLDGVVKQLEAQAALVPTGPIEVNESLSAAVARYELRHAAGATLELVEPRGSGAADDYRSAWGEGPWFTGLAVPGAHAIAEAALLAGATPGHARDDPLIEIEPGMLFELSDLGA